MDSADEKTGYKNDLSLTDFHYWILAFIFASKFLSMKQALKTIIVKYFAIFAVSLFVVFCSSPSANNTDKTIFRYNEAVSLTSLDPAYAKDLPHIWVSNQLFNGLVNLDDKLNIVPAIAKSWQISDDGLVYTFQLRRDVFFHDSPAFAQKTRTVKASDVVYSFNRILDPALASPGAWIFNYVARNDTAYAFKALNDSIFEVRLKQVFPPFLGMLSMPYASIVPHEAIDFYGNDFRKNPVGTGPFHFQLWKEQLKLVMRKNENYFEQLNGKRLPFIDAISVSFLADKQIAFMEFVKGNLDFMSGIDSRYKDELLTRNGRLRTKYQDKIYLLREPFLNTEYAGFYIDKSLNDIDAAQQQALRKLVNYSIDRDKMLRFLRNGIGKPAHSGMIPFGMPGFDTLEQIGYAFDLQKANDLMREFSLAGKKITLSTTADYTDLGKYIQSALTDVGLDASMEILPAASMRQFRANGSLPFFRASWVADYPDAENYLSLFYSKNASPNGPNYTHFNNKAFDQLYEEAMREVDAPVRHKLYRQLDSLVMVEAPVIVLFYDEVLRFVQHNVKNLGSNPVNMLNLKQVIIEKEN